ncbi:MAG TPA: BamA/TamA family outer membrane protein [Polyangiaceae bacterium]|nr:BamA/TamA family outer membrane protein [Polyangiaceae bacterium]
MTRTLGVFRGYRVHARALRLLAGVALLCFASRSVAAETPRAATPSTIAAPDSPVATASAPTGVVPPTDTTPRAPPEARTSDADTSEPPPAPPATPPDGVPGTTNATAAPSVTQAPDNSIEEQGTLKYALDGIEVRGNGKTRSRVVLRYVPFRPGDIFDVDDPRVELTRYRLLGTGFFRDVQLSLRKGRLRGHVVLIVEVVERNTLVVNDLWMGLAATASTVGTALPLTPYAGLDAAETNLAGTGMTLGAAAGIAHDQYALRLRFFDPSLFLGKEWMTSGTLLFNHANDFFGNHDVGFVNPLEKQLDNSVAVVQYERFGGTVGVGRDLSVTTQFWANYRLERINAHVPLSANDLRGNGSQAEREPIDFYIQRDKSVLSTLSATVQHDTRDKPILATRGWFASVTTEVSLSPLGSDYAYARIDAMASKWWTLPWEHVLRLRLFGGAISGRAPSFERYFVGDLSDFRAARVLGLNVERRLAPNFFHTDVGEVRYGDYAAKFDAEYRIPLYRGTRAVYGIDVFARAGVYFIAGQKDITQPPRGYSGAGLIPVDFTANFGLQMDTSAGGFTFAFANLLGFIPGLGNGQ